MKAVDFIVNSARKTPGMGSSLADFSPQEAARVRGFLQSFCEYAPTPLVSLPGLAQDFSLGRIFVKDESKRFGLNAFKVLGGGYAIGRLLAQKLDRPIETLTRDELCSDAVRAKLGPITFATATDGNHGRGVAWMAQQLGQRAKVYMPKGSAEIRAQNIRVTGAACAITDRNYDDTVRMANSEAEKNGWLVVQDTAWEGYEDIPRWIMQGYMALAIEALEQLRAAGVEAPTHVFLQAGVGSFAGAVLGFFTAALGGKAPVATIVEPHKANCIYTSIKAADGMPHTVAGEMDTLMAGLACGEPSTVSWPILRDYATASASCPDFIAANGMRILAAPVGDDPQVISGESGAATCGFLEFAMRRPHGKAIREALNLTPASTVLLISTEGDTSPDLYRDIVWHGKHSNEED